MTTRGLLTCPDCDEPLAFAFRDTSGVGAHKRGDNYNTVPDTDHYVCFGCASAWRQRLAGPLTPDVVGQLAFFTCRHPDCGRTLVVVAPSDEATDNRLGCSEGHAHVVRPLDDGLTMVEASASEI
jgi:hypothetical protein